MSICCVQLGYALGKSFIHPRCRQLKAERAQAATAALHVPGFAVWLRATLVFLDCCLQAFWKALPSMMILFEDSHDIHFLRTLKSERRMQFFCSSFHLGTYTEA